MVRTRLLTLGLLVLLASACSNSPSKSSNSRYDVEQDYGPEQPIDFSHLPDAKPKAEPRTRAGNKSPYTVLGKTYRVMPDSRGFNQRGVASWYGKKFHGRKTSNGEVYDMYAMTAAHKSLPLPSFVRVRNRNNGREVVVRVNDRGPFHGGRIIDLSYAAASKLGFVQHGTAPVEIEAIDSGSPALDFLSPKPTALAKSPDLQLKPGPEPELNYRYTSGRKRTFVQVGAFSNQDSATALAQRLRNALAQPVRLSRKPGTGIYRVQVGPLAMASKLLGVQKALQQMQLGSSIVIYE